MAEREPGLIGQGGQGRTCAVPTIIFVGASRGDTLARCPPYESRSVFTFANTLRNISGVSTRVFVL